MLYEVITKTTIFPLVIKGDKGVKLSLFKRLEGMKNLYNNSRDVLGFGYALETISMNTVITSYSIHYTKLYEWRRFHRR